MQQLLSLERGQLWTSTVCWWETPKNSCRVFFALVLSPPPLAGASLAPCSFTNERQTPLKRKIPRNSRETNLRCSTPLTHLKPVKKLNKKKQHRPFQVSVKRNARRTHEGTRQLCCKPSAQRPGRVPTCETGRRHSVAYLCGCLVCAIVCWCLLLVWAPSCGPVRTRPRNQPGASWCQALGLSKEVLGGCQASCCGALCHLSKGFREGLTLTIPE